MRAWLLGAAAAALLSSCAPKTHVIAACKMDDPNVLCGINRPEDIEIIPNSRWLMTTGARISPSG